MSNANKVELNLSEFLWRDYLTIKDSIGWTNILLQWFNNKITVLGFEDEDLVFSVETKPKEWIDEET